MDGWETRRLREPRAEPYDWCVIRLGAAGLVRGVDVETTHFKGNYPESCAVDVASGFSPTTAEMKSRTTEWREILKQTPLKGDAHNLFAIDDAPRATHLRLRIFPDGGVARLRAYGEAVAAWERLRRRSCSDMFFGSRHSLIMPGDATHMGDGWETRRRRGPGHDWTIVRLAAPGTIHRVEIDTRHFKGNAPAACSLEGSADERTWTELLRRTPLTAHATHTFEPSGGVGSITHVRFNIYPDGGVGRLRLYGTPT